MARRLTDEEIAQKQRDASLRHKIKGLFSEVPERRADAIDALTEAWDLDKPSFRMEEMAAMDPQAVALAAMRRDSAKEVINWLTKL